MRTRAVVFALLSFGFTMIPQAGLWAQDPRRAWDPSPARDSVIQAGALPQDPTSPDKFPNIWSLDILLSNDGFGLGTIFRRSLTPDLSWFASFSISESKDEREVEYYDYFYGTTVSPGKLNRFLVLPLMAGVQYRLFRDDIVDTFRPYVNAAVGPAMIYTMPYVEQLQTSDGLTYYDQMDFFKAIGRGHPTYTFGGYVGFGANFGTQRTSIFGVNFRYYIASLMSDGLPSLFDERTGAIKATKKNFGGFVISINVGTAF
jgi:hypothetical protein